MGIRVTQTLGTGVVKGVFEPKAVLAVAAEQQTHLVW